MVAPTGSGALGGYSSPTYLQYVGTDGKPSPTASITDRPSNFGRAALNVAAGGVNLANQGFEQFGNFLFSMNR